MSCRFYPQSLGCIVAKLIADCYQHTKLDCDCYADEAVRY